MRKIGCAALLTFGGIILTVVLTVATINSAASQINIGAPGKLKTGAVPKWAVPLLEKYGHECTTITPPVLAAQIKTESNWNRHAVSPTGAQGISQFEPGTWAKQGVDGDGDAKANPSDPADAIASQAHYMCSLVHQIKTTHIDGDVLDNALAAYNAGLGAVQHYDGIPPYHETQAYIAKIKRLIKTYSAGGQGIATTSATSTAGAVLAAAKKEIGLPYAWGGGTLNGPSQGVAPDAGVTGFDCSSLVRYAYYQGTSGKITLPRVTRAQYQATKKHPVPTSHLQPGDLLFYGTSPPTIHHVALYTGGGRMIEAYESGTPIRSTHIRLGGDFYAATRVLTHNTRSS